MNNGQLRFSMWPNMKAHVNIGEMLIQGGELLFKSLFLKDSSTFIVTVVLIPFSPTQFFRSPPYGGSCALYIFFRLSPLYTCFSSKPILEYMSYQASSLTLCEWWWLRLHCSEVFFHINALRKVAAVHLMRW